MITSAITNFSADQRRLAVQRLTALWAFAESGLGGMLHALQAPFIGLIIGGMAVLLITMIAFFSQQKLTSILHSVLIVLIIKAIVSPYTPFPAYIAVTFQAITGYILFSLLRINLLSIVLLSTIAMMESAIQKLLLLTLFFGESFWKATNNLVDFITRQTGIATANGNFWVIGIYLFIYFIGGLFIAWLAYKTIKEIFLDKNLPLPSIILSDEISFPNNKKNKFKLATIFLLLVVIAALLFFFSNDQKDGWMAVLKTLSWTSAVIFLWYFIISPVFTKFIQNILKKKETRYSEEVADVLSFLPVLKQLAVMAWQKSNQYKGWHRVRYFISTMVHWSLTWSADHTCNK